jgi:hypothetical protein
MAASDHPCSSTRLSAARNARSRNNARSFASDSSRDAPLDDVVEDDVDVDASPSRARAAPASSSLAPASLAFALAANPRVGVIPNAAPRPLIPAVTTRRSS